MAADRDPPRFAYPARHRWAFLPTAGFFVVLLLILWLQPDWLSGDGMDPGTRAAGFWLSGAMLAFLALQILQRWRNEPFAVEVERDALVTWPAMGKPRRVPFDSISSVEERTRPYLRGRVEMELRTGRRRRIVIRGDIGGYPRLRRLVLENLPPEARTRWAEPEQ